MICRLTASPPPWCAVTNHRLPTHHHHHRLHSTDLNLYSTKLAPNTAFICNSTAPGTGPGTGDNESKNVLDAFFLGKALAEAVNERVESAVGEFLSTVGKLQAEQQKQVQDFQEEVMERAKRAKEKAAREATEAEGLIPKTYAETVSARGGDGDSVITLTPSNSTSFSDLDGITVNAADSGPNDEDPVSGFVPIED